MGLGLHASQARSRILAHKHCNSRRDDLFLPRAGSIRILSRGKPGTPPCKSGQLEKDLGLEASSLRHAARLMIFEIMRSFLVGSSAPVALAPGFAIHWGERMEFRTLSVSVRALSHFNLDSF